MSFPNSIILWPKQIDTFYTLEDNTTYQTNNRQILYAEHYDKIANAIGVMQTYWTNAVPASGDASLKGIAWSYNFSVEVSDLFAVVKGNNSYILPGWNSQVLPFEIVFSTDPVNNSFPNYTFGGDNLYVWYSSISTMNSTLIAGLPYLTNFPLITSTVSNNYGYNFTSNCWTEVGNDCLLVRGTITTDLSDVSWGTSAESLLITITGINT